MLPDIGRVAKILLHAQSVRTFNIDTETHNLRTLKELLDGRLGPLEQFGVSKPEIRNAIDRTINKLEAAHRARFTRDRQISSGAAVSAPIQKSYDRKAMKRYSKSKQSMRITRKP